MADFSALSDIPTKAVSNDKLPIALDQLSASYPPADYTLRFDMRLGTGFAKTVTFTNTDGKHSGTLDLSAVEAGLWRYTIRATDSAENSRVVQDGSIQVLADPNSGSTYSHAERTLAAIEALIENRATKDQQSYSIQGRSLNRMTIDELMRWRSHYRAEVAAERNSGSGRSGRVVTLASFK